MKKTIALFLAACLLLGGCAQLIPPRTTLPAEDAVPAKPIAAATEATEAVQPTEAPTEEPTEEPTTEPPTEPEPEYFNPLNGEILDAPFDKRFFGVSVNNLAEAMPHSGLMQADIVFETLVNNSIIRCFALFSDISGVEAVGPIRSDRIMWNDLGLRYDAVVTHASGSNQVLRDAKDRQVANVNADQWAFTDVISFRDKERSKAGYSWDATLYGIGSGLVDYARDNGIRTELDPDRNFFLRFTDDGTPADGENAEQITITISAPAWKSGGGVPQKQTIMTYDPSLGKYAWSQYGKDMVDGRTGEPEAFQNVVILEAQIGYEGIYQKVDFAKGGMGWFACGGKAERIHWVSARDSSAISLTTMDFKPVQLGRGNTYIAITQAGSEIAGIG